MPSSKSPTAEGVLSRRELFRRLLTPYWLRAESPVWYAHEAFLVRERLGREPKGPTLELGCMDGTTSFILLGGEFGDSFDVYGDVNWSKDSIRWNSLKDDYFNAAKKKEDGPDIKTRPEFGFDVGLSWKSAHLEKAARLGTYGKLIEHDPNSAFDCFEDESFETIWGPNLYWIDNFEGLFSEIRRFLKPGGRLITVLPDKAALELMLFNLKEHADPDWIKDLDRGRHSNIARQARTDEEWKSFFAKTGLDISHHEKFLPSPAFTVNDVGFRPMFPVLMDIYETLKKADPGDFARIKKSWIDTCFHFLSPLMDVEWMEKAGYPKVWNLFELRR